MAEIELSNIGILQEVGETLSQRSGALRADLASLKRQFTDKIGGSQGQAIDAYVTVLQEFESELYDLFPQVITNFGQVFSNYYASLIGLGFSPEDFVKLDLGQLSSYQASMTKADSSQKQEISTKLSGLRKILSQVSAEVPSYSDPRQSLNLEEESLFDYLNDLGTNLTSLESAMLAAKREFVSALGTTSDSFNQMQVVMDTILAISDPKSGLNPGNVAVLINRGLLTAGNLKSYLYAPTNVTDTQAINHYLKEEYRELAALSPEKISGSTYAAMVSSMHNRLMTGDTAVVSDLERLANAILERPDHVSEDFFNGLALGAEQLAALAYQKGVRIFPDVDLDALTSRKQGKLKSKDSDYLDAKKKIDKAYLLSTLFQGLMVADVHDDKVKVFGIDVPVGDTVPGIGASSRPSRLTKITGLSLSGNDGFSFTAYQEIKSPNGKVLTPEERVEFSFKTSTLYSGDVAFNEKAAKFYQLRNEREELVSNWLADMAKGTVSLHPYGAIGVELYHLTEAIEKGDLYDVLNSGSLAGSELADSASWSKTSTVLGNHVSSTLQYAQRDKALEEAIEQAKHDVDSSFFEHTGFEVALEHPGNKPEETLFAGHRRYDLDGYEYKMNLQANGAQARREEDVFGKGGMTYIKDEDRSKVRQAVINQGYSDADVDFVLYGQSKYPDRTIDEMGGRYKDIWEAIGTEYEEFKSNPGAYDETINP